MAHYCNVKWSVPSFHHLVCCSMVDCGAHPRASYHFNQWGKKLSLELSPLICSNSDQSSKACHPSIIQRSDHCVSTDVWDGHCLKPLKKTVYYSKTLLHQMHLLSEKILHYVWDDVVMKLLPFVFCRPQRFLRLMESMATTFLSFFFEPFKKLFNAPYVWAALLINLRQ